MREPLRRRLEAGLVRLWFGPAATPTVRLVRALLAPLSMLVGIVTSSRRRQIVAAREEHRSAPLIIVVGNLVVGGAGKTPLVATLATELSARGWRCGILARGYRSHQDEARLVRTVDTASEVGDEPLLLARETGVPVAVGANRLAALELLCAASPDLAIVISDDGLQHVGLPRHVEIAVFDARGAGNERLLPAGPLREPLAHVRSMDAVVINDAVAAPVTHPRTFAARMIPEEFVALADPSWRIRAADFAAWAGSRSVLAIAGIAAPERFFAALTALGLRARTLALGDHARIDPDWLAQQPERLVVMTTKDAVKCGRRAVPDMWALHSVMQCDPALIDWLEAIARGQTTARDSRMPPVQGAAADASRPAGRTCGFRRTGLQP